MDDRTVRFLSSFLDQQENDLSSVLHPPENKRYQLWHIGRESIKTKMDHNEFDVDVSPLSTAPMCNCNGNAKVKRIGAEKRKHLWGTFIAVFPFKERWRLRQRDIEASIRKATSLSCWGIRICAPHEKKERVSIDREATSKSGRSGGIPRGERDEAKRVYMDL